MEFFSLFEMLETSLSFSYAQSQTTMIGKQKVLFYWNICSMVVLLNVKVMLCVYYIYRIFLQLVIE